MVPPPPPLPEPSSPSPSGPLKRSPAPPSSVPTSQAKRDPSPPTPVPPATEGQQNDPTKPQGGRVGGPPTELACRSCLGVSFMTSAMRKKGQNSACYGLRRSVEMPQLPEVRDEYIEEVLRSRAYWTYVCVGASEAIEAADPDNAALTPDFSPPLPTCRGLLVFMDGEEDDSDSLPHPTATQQAHSAQAKPPPGPSVGKPAAPVPMPPRGGGDTAPTPLSSDRQDEQAGKWDNNNPNATPDPSDPLRRVMDFWSRAADNYGEKYTRSAQRLVGAMDKQARHVVVFTKRLLTGRGSDDEGGHDQNPPGPPRPK